MAKRKQIDEVQKRQELEPRRDPYWKRLSQGRYVGFRRRTPATPGSWIARVYDPDKPASARSKFKDPGGYYYRPLGDFADRAERDRFDAAKAAAEGWFKHLDRGGSTARATVKGACEGYVENRRVEKSAATAADVRGRYARLVNDDPIGRVELAKLAPRHLVDWKGRVLDRGGARGTYNRNATALRAALNLAYKRRDVASDHAWRDELKPLANAARRRTLYLDPAERRRLVEAASNEAQPLFKTLNMLPMRPGEVAALRVDYLKVHQRSLEIPTGKAEARVIPLTAAAVAHFSACAKGKLPAAWLIARADGGQWKKEAWRDEIKAAASKANVPLAVVAYTIRHSVITDLVTGGLDLFTVAKLSGTSVVMIEKHYGHLQAEHARGALERLALS